MGNSVQLEAEGAPSGLKYIVRSITYHADCSPYSRGTVRVGFEENHSKLRIVVTRPLLVSSSIKCIASQNIHTQCRSHLEEPEEPDILHARTATPAN
jgi:hypothetical protein